MTHDRRRNVSSLTSTFEDDKQSSVKYETGENSVIVPNDDDDSCLKSEIAQLRRRWELACVLNFLKVFDPIIGGDLKLTAEEIEAGLVKPDAVLAQLHIQLLKGIPPVSKSLYDCDVWVTVLCKKLAMWWPWVAEDEIPLTAAKGEEMTRYRELDPVNRLIILKALCEIRADQNDVASYINDALKSGTEVSCFRKDKIGEDGDAASYWFDGNEQLGHRIYKEVRETHSKIELKDKMLENIPPISFHWETVATNLQEFRSVVNDLLSSEFMAEVDVGKTIKSDLLPVVETLWKKKERAFKRKERQEKFLTDFRTFAARATRSCRQRNHINYTFDEYDRNIDEAIELSKLRNTTEDERSVRIQKRQQKIASSGPSDIGTGIPKKLREKGHLYQDSDEKDNSPDGETESKSLQEAGNDDDDGVEMVNDSDYESDGHADKPGDRTLCISHEDENSGHDMNDTLQLLEPSQCSKPANITSQAILDTRNLNAKNRLRQRPTINSAIDCVVLDSDDNSSEHKSGYSNEVVDDSEVSGSSSL